MSSLQLSKLHPGKFAGGLRRIGNRLKNKLWNSLKRFLQSARLKLVDENYLAFKNYMEELLDKQIPFKHSSPRLNMARVTGKLKNTPQEKKQTIEKTKKVW